jgi:hypothetical protein
MEFTGYSSSRITSLVNTLPVFKDSNQYNIMICFSDLVLDLVISKWI